MNPTYSNSHLILNYLLNKNILKILVICKEHTSKVIQDKGLVHEFLILIRLVLSFIAF